MNTYKITSASCGMVRTVLCSGSDIIDAIQRSGLQWNEVIKAELVESSCVEDYTIQ